MNVVKIIKKNKLLVGVFFTYIFLFAVMPDKGVQSARNSFYYVKEMLEVLPVIFLLTTLIETWVPKKVIMSSFGEGSGIKGNIFSFLLGSFSAGPIYAAFPICKILLKKGASIINIVIILSTWAVVKVPMLINEAKFLGPKFMVVRWILTTISILIMAYIVSILVKKENLPIEVESGERDFIEIKSEYCVGCGACVNAMPDYFDLIDGKIKLKCTNIEEGYISSIEKVIEKCPVKAIFFK